MKTVTFLVIMGVVQGHGELIEMITSVCNMMNPSREKLYNDTITADKVRVHLYSGGQFHTYPLANTSQLMSSLNPSIGVAIYTHGYNGNATSETNTRLAASLTSTGLYNFIAFDAGSFYSGPDYVYIAGCVPRVADLLFRLISDLYTGGVAYEKFYLIGESLGAHTSSLAARRFANQHGKILKRMTGLDPAAPCFPNNGISPDDALFVDIVFTSYLAATSRFRGHVQYFANNVFGMQPGCSSFPFPDVFCSHKRAKELFIEAVASPFLAKKCQNLGDLGTCDQSVTRMMTHVGAFAVGNYFFKTNAASPYNMGAAGIN